MTNTGILEYARGVMDKCRAHDVIPEELYINNHVYRGLRDVNGKGVITGITNVSCVQAYEDRDGEQVPCDGKLWYRGMLVQDVIDKAKGGFAFEPTAYYLLTGEYPDGDVCAEFCRTLAFLRRLPKNFVRDVIMKAPTEDIMNNMMRSILTLASYDRSSSSQEDILVQCLRLIAQFPALAVYAYNAYVYYNKHKSMILHAPKAEYSTAQNILRMIRVDKSFTPLEAAALDTALVLHMDHGGGNNSTFTTRVVTSAGSDTYATIAAAMASLKGYRHGGANIRVVEMMADMEKTVGDISDKDAIRTYLSDILEKKAFDGTGLIYGMGHAIYSVSDPREKLLRVFAENLAEEKGLSDRFAFYETVAQEAIELIYDRRKIYKGVCPNVDFYSGFVYEMLGIPRELFTPMFAVARVAGWCAHRIEELIGGGRIIRPGYLNYIGNGMVRM